MAALAQNPAQENPVHETILYTPANLSVFATNRTAHFSVDFTHGGYGNFSFAGGVSNFSNGSGHSTFYQSQVDWRGSALNHRLVKGMEIGPGENFQGEGLMAEYVHSYHRTRDLKPAHSSCFGRFLAANFYMGVRFQVKGETHYGWIRFSSMKCYPVLGTITGYAYNMVPNAPIQAGQTRSGEAQSSQVAADRSLGQLALGSAGRN